MPIDKQKILAGRKAVDDYRTAHTKLYEKGWHKGIPEEHTPPLNELKEALKELGFNSLEGFFTANEVLNKQVIEQELLNCYRVVGRCDGCIGRKRWCSISCVRDSEQTIYDEQLDTFIVDLSRLKGRHIANWVNSFGEYKKDTLPSIVYDKDGRFCAAGWIKVAKPSIDWRWQ